MKALCLYLHMMLFVFQTVTQWNLVKICIWLNLAVKGLNSDKWQLEMGTNDIKMSSIPTKHKTTTFEILTYILPPTPSLRGLTRLVWHCSMNDWEFLTALLLPTILHRTTHSVDHLQATFAWSVIINSNHLQKYFWVKSTFFLFSFLKT